MKANFGLFILIFFVVLVVWQPLSAETPHGETCVEILIPLYIYPNWYDASYQWDDVVSASNQVPITAIVNPASGPTAMPNSDYVQGMNDLLTGNVKMIGYVYTDYGNRPIADVKADIDIYASSAWTNWISGIFFDEVSSSSAEIAYYTDLYDHVHLQSSLDYVTINPGTNTDETYFDTPATESGVIFESFGANWPSYTPDTYIANYDRFRFAMMAHETPDVATMQAYVDLAVSRNVGYVYITDQLLATNPWDDLPIYWQAEVDYIEQANMNCPVPTAIELTATGQGQSNLYWILFVVGAYALLSVRPLRRGLTKP